MYVRLIVNPSHGVKELKILYMTWLNTVEHVVNLQPVTTLKDLIVARACLLVIVARACLLVAGYILVGIPIMRLASYFTLPTTNTCNVNAVLCFYG